MTTPSRQAESSANALLGALLQGMMGGASVRSENTQVIAGEPALRPDILITDSQRAPVVVEAEYMPAYTAEEEAKARLGLRLADEDKRIEAAIALRYPADIANAADIDGALRTARLEYAVFYEDDTRFPTSGWISGGASDLADLIRLASVSQSAIDAATDALQKGIERVAKIMDEMSDSAPAAIARIAQRLGMGNVPQTRRMACAILANALVFQERIAGIHEGVKRPSHVAGNGVTDPQRETLRAWREILEINYWPIFAIAIDILDQIDAHHAARVMKTLELTASAVNALGVINSHDLTGRIFQRLISDRKYLATFYTLPASAALLARIAVAKLEGVDWADADAIGKLRVADFACGTGALLSSVYEQFANRHERAGGDAADLHKPMMEEALYGCDVMPSAIHITGATLSGIQPALGFELSRLYPMRYGRQTDGSIQIGSLELLQSSTVMTLFNISDPAQRTGSRGEETSLPAFAEFPDEWYDLVIMNPPFTRNVTHEGAYANTFAAAFAAFGSTDADQKAMSSRMSSLKRDSCYHGSAGMASAFAGVGHRKLKQGGVLALVLPLAAASGTSWQKFRQMLMDEYTDLEVFSIAANGRDMAFSSDTGMAECLVVARKRRANEEAMSAVKFASLERRPAGFIQSDMIAKNILNANDDLREIGDGPYGGTPISVGEEQIGELIRTPYSQSDDGQGWGAVRIRDFSITQTAYALAQSKLWLPASNTPLELKMASLGDIAQFGKYHLSIIGKPPQGCFTKTTFRPAATYPALWNHNAKNETRIVCEPDSQLRVRRGMEDQAADVWATASRSHLNAEFTCGSQALAVAFTERETIGGSSWPNVIFGKDEYDYAFAVWCNSTLGLVSYWWHSNRQQSSKIRMTISSAPQFPVLDLRALTDAQLAAAQEIFDQFRELELQPAYLADADANRALLDRRVLCDMLGFDEDVYRGVRMLAAKWCSEPSVHGGKRRPKGAGLAV